MSDDSSARARRRVPWRGVFTALVTPFTEDGSLDEDGLRRLVRRQVDAGVHGLVPCGTTGESPALNPDEWSRVIELTVEVAGDSAWVVAGAGTNNTALSAARVARASELGADGALVITPYYNKPTPDGLVRHFTHITQAVPEFPIIVYNVPGRTGVNLTPRTFSRLLDLPEVAALKEASGDLTQVWECARRYGLIAPVFSGEDAINLPVWEIGGHGAVSVLSNIVPDLVVEQFNAHESDNSEAALELHDRFRSLAKNLFVETSPAPAKFVLLRLGLPAGPVRMPLAPLRRESEAVLEADLRELGLL